MIDTWFKKDVEKIFNTHPIVVFVDESKEAMLLPKNKTKLSHNLRQKKTTLISKIMSKSRSKLS